MKNDEAKKMIAEKLKHLRTTNNLKIPEVREMLEARGITVAEKTIYGYENCASSPTVNIFLALCEIYQVANVLTEFGYASDENAGLNQETMSFTEKAIIRKYRQLSVRDKKLLEDNLDRFVESSDSVKSTEHAG